MAISGHWIEAKIVQTPSGPQYALKLRADLIGFICVPGHHDGEHLAQAFMHVLDRIGITSKVINVQFSSRFVGLLYHPVWLGHPR